MTHEERAREWLVANGYTDLDDDPTPHQVCRLAAEFAAVAEEAVSKDRLSRCDPVIGLALHDSARNETSYVTISMLPSSIVGANYLAGCIIAAVREIAKRRELVFVDRPDVIYARKGGPICSLRPYDPPGFESDSLRDGKDQPSEPSDGSQKV